MINYNESLNQSTGCDFDWDKMFEREFELEFEWMLYQRLKGMRSKPEKTLTISTQTPTAQMNETLDELQSRVMEHVAESQRFEDEIYSDINTEAYLRAKPHAVVDWLDLKFVVDPSKCKFYGKPGARSYIKAYLTKHTGIRHYIQADSEVVQDGASFTIRLHDIENQKALRKITDLLREQYGCKVEEMTVEAIELALDFYNAPSSAFLVALHKSLKYPKASSRMRIYKTKGTARGIPESVHELVELIEDGFNIASGDHRFDELCTRAYLKRTDMNGKSLPVDQHRLRFEMTFKKIFFERKNLDCSLFNLPSLITHGFKQMQFTRLNKRASEDEKEQYRKCVKAFGQEWLLAPSCSCHKRDLHDAIKMNGPLNEIKRLQAKALADKFKARKNR